MERCKCVRGGATPTSYPKRLIALDWDHKRSLEQTIRLIETDDLDWDRLPLSRCHYATLSHCWGTAVSNVHYQARLLKHNIRDRKRGMDINTLPTTFRDALQFAARFPYVGFIWIDTLCIIQDDEADWLEQSARMGDIYKDAFINISATAATNSGEGLSFSRRPELLFENEVVLNIGGLPGAATSSVPRMSTEHSVELENISFGVGGNKAVAISSQDEAFQKPDHGILRRCTILDISVWTDRVDKAPVNQRGWVIQERLMAPRVLHFCRDRVAWECREFEAAEGLPEGTPNYIATAESIQECNRFKALEDIIEGRRLRHSHLQGYDDPDPHLQPTVYSLELWHRIVELYCKTALTDPKDRLIALAGIARSVSKKIEASIKPLYEGSAGSTTPALPRYIAGIFSFCIVSQLLWYIDPLYDSMEDSLRYMTTAASSYCAPSFSWACITAIGIRFAEITDQDLLITIESASVIPAKGSDEFGLLEAAHIVLLGKLRKAVLLEKPRGRYGWRLVDRNYLDNEEHTIVFLDCPARDGQAILGPGAGIYIVPAAMGERNSSEDSKYMTCLVLQFVEVRAEGPAYRRIGLTKLSPYGDRGVLRGLKILTACPSDLDIPHNGYDPETGIHRFLVI
jgi:hypothetical protein